MTTRNSLPAAGDEGVTSGIEFRRTPLNLTAVPPREWARVLPEWERLFTVSVNRTVFLSAGWIAAWWQTFADGLEPLLLTAWNNAGQLIALAPLYLQQQRLPFAGRGPVELRLMGDYGVGSEYLGLLVAPGYEDDFLEALADRIEGEWTVADLHGLREDVVLNERLIRTLTAVPDRVYREDRSCSVIVLPDSYESYLASLTPKFRSAIRYRTNKLQRMFEVKLVRTMREEEIEPHLERLFTMHQARWVAEGRPGSFASPRKRVFYRRVACDFLKRGWLRFYHLQVDGSIRASQFGFAYDGVLHSLQEAFDHTFHPPGIGGIGVVLRGMVIRECIAEGLRAYDFLGGSEEFKTRWNTMSHTVWRVRIGAQGLKGSAAFSAIVGIARARRFARQHLLGCLLQARSKVPAWRNGQRMA